MKAKKIVIAAFCGILLLLVAYRVFQSRFPGHQAGIGPSEEERAFSVTVAKVTRGSLEEMTSLAGTVSPRVRVEVFPDTSGLIQEVKVKEGDKVSKDEVLAVVRGKEGGLISTRSPIAGIIARRSCEIGDFVLSPEAANTQPLFTIEDISVVKVQVGIPETLVPTVKVGREARVRVEAYPLDHYPLAIFKGTITSMSPGLDLSSRTATAEVTIENRDGRLRPGMSAMVGLLREKLEDALLVPKESVVAGDESHLIYVVKDDVIHEREVEVGASDGRMVQVLNPARSQNPSVSGEHSAFRPKGSIEEGDEVVIIGARMVYDGQKVKVLR